MVAAIPRSVIFDPTGSTIYLFGLETGDRCVLLPVSTFILSKSTPGSPCLPRPDNARRRATSGRLCKSMGSALDALLTRYDSGWASASSAVNRFLVDTVIGPFVIFNLHSNTPSMTLSRPQDTVRGNRIKQGVLAEDGNVAVCGSNDGRILIYDLQGTSPTTPSQVLAHRDSSPVQALAVSYNSVNMPVCLLDLTLEMLIIMQAFSFPDYHIIVSCATEQNPSVRVWLRTRIVHDTPLKAPKRLQGPEKETPSPPPSPPYPESKADVITLIVFLLFVLLVWDWCIERNIVRPSSGPHNKT